MKKLHEVQSLIEQVKANEGPALEVQEEILVQAYTAMHENRSGIAVKILSIAGSLVAMVAFIGFLFLGGLYDSGAGMITAGIIFAALGIIITKATENLILDTFSCFLYISGMLLLTAGLMEAHLGEKYTSGLILLAAFITLLIVQDYIMAFVAVLIASSASMVLFSYFMFRSDWIHIPLLVHLILVISLVAGEARFLSQTNKQWAKLYNPLLLGLSLGLMVTLNLVSMRGMLNVSPWINCLPGMAAIAGIVFFMPRIIRLLQVQDKARQLALYVGVVLVLLPTIMAPAIAGAVLLMCLFFLINYKTGFGLSIIALLWSVSRYYYDLQFTLLTKSIVLMASGVLFIVFYWIIRHQLPHDETL